MRTHFCLFLSCLFCFALPLASGYGSENNAPPAEQDRKAGERMTLTIKDIEYAFRWCPAGSFMMGSPRGENGRDNDEGLHRVTLSKGFWMLETVVTQMMWVTVMGTEPSYFKGDLQKLPVEKVSWDDCQEYIQKLNDLLAGTPGAPAGFKFSLPTEAQWEYACRAGTTTAYHFGDTLNGDKANCDGTHPYPYMPTGTTAKGPYLMKTTEVRTYPANAWGLYDMHGNVREWCLDWYEGIVTDPPGYSKGERRVFRGGAWAFSAWNCRAAYRTSLAPSQRNAYTGVRLSLVSDEVFVSP